MNWIKIMSNDVLEGENFIRLIRVDGKKICLVKVGDEFFATQNRCPHAGADLSLGICKDKKLICSFHRYEYDLKTGRGAAGQGDYLNIYPIKKEEDGLYVGFKDKWAFIRKFFQYGITGN